MVFHPKESFLTFRSLVLLTSANWAAIFRSMPIRGNSFLSVKQLHLQDLKSIFETACFFKKQFQLNKRFDDKVIGEGKEQKTVLMVFAEPSTRTRLSFQMACARLGIRSLIMDNLATSSVTKGETLEDTLLNVAAMKPDAIVVRYGQHPELDHVLANLGCPVVSAGIGTAEHPSQGLLDIMTMEENLGPLKGQKVLIVGDVLYSRVANSNMLLLKQLGAEIGFCTPEELAPKNADWADAKRFTDLKDGFKWASVVMALRMQKERHIGGLSIGSYRDQFRISSEHLDLLSSKGIILHPGPVIVGVDFTPDVLKDPRCKVLDQVTNGVFLRAAILAEVLELEVKIS